MFLDPRVAELAGPPDMKDIAETVVYLSITAVGVIFKNNHWLEFPKSGTYSSNWEDRKICYILIDGIVAPLTIGVISFFALNTIERAVRAVT